MGLGVKKFLARFDSEHRVFFNKAFSLTALTAVGQLTYPLALPLIGYLYSVADFGVFTIYMAIVNIVAPFINLKFEGALYASQTNRNSAAILRLSVTTVLISTLLLTFLLFMFQESLSAAGLDVLPTIVWFLPLGMLLSGTWDVATAWAVRTGHIKTLGIARFSQPVTLTATHLLFGWLGWGTAGLLVGSIIAYLVYIGMIFLRALNLGHIYQMRRVQWHELVALAKHERHFPYFTMPAQWLTLILVNTPQLLVGVFYGKEIAGLYGLAYRIVAAPLRIISMPLSNILMSYLSDHEKEKRMSIVYLTLALAVGLVSMPITVIGQLSPFYVPIILPEKWAAIDGYIALLAISAAFQALAVPFVDTYSLLKRQKARLTIDVIRIPLVIGSFVTAALSDLAPLPAITILVLFNAAGFLIMLVDAVVHVRRYVSTNSS